MDMMMASNSCKNGSNNNNTTAFVHHHQQQTQQQQMQEAVRTVVPQEVVKGRQQVFGEHNNKKPQPPQLDSRPLRCPRCGSSDIRFAYYNNYNTSQPRYLCKGCRRYWTHGGSLRNIPVGGRCRKNRHTSPLLPSSSSSGSNNSSDKQHHHPAVPTSRVVEPPGDVVLPITSWTAAEPQQDVLPTSSWAAEEPRNFPNVLPTFMSGSFVEMPPPFTPISAPPSLPFFDVRTPPSFVDMLTGGGFVDHKGNNSFYDGSTSSDMMNMPLFGSGAGGEGATTIGSGGAATHQGGQVAGADERREDGSSAL